MGPSESYRAKILSLDELAQVSLEVATAGRRRVLCHGKFEVMHPGHMRHLEWARHQGDLLFVTLSEDCEDWKGSVALQARLEHVAALYMVDYVCPVPCIDATRSIEALHPDVLVRGQEFQTLRRRTAARERAAVSEYGGELLFSSGLGGMSLLGPEATESSERSQPGKSLFQMIERRGLKLPHFEELLSRFSGLQVGVIGDAIVDEYIFCDALGMSAEDPVIVVRPRQTRRYIGGAAIVAEHTQALGAQAHLFSVTGDDEAGGFLSQSSETSGVQYHLLTDPTRPTTIKQRFLAGGKKLLRVSYLEERSLSDALAENLVKAVTDRLDDLDLIIFSDFSYGVNCPYVVERISEAARRNGTRVTADVQCSSQIATVTKYQGVDLVTPTEREARMSLWDMNSSISQIGVNLLHRTGDRDIVIKLGENGLLILHGNWTDGRLVEVSTEYLGSFAEEVKDPMGAGDALLAACSLALAAGGDIFEASLLGNVAAALEVVCVGNVPITRVDLERRLGRVLEPLFEMRV